jgi:hypothetical protein
VDIGTFAQLLSSRPWVFVLVYGLYIEMKAGKGRLTPGQVSFREALEPHGYKFFVAYSWHDAAQAIADHVGFTFDV